MTGLAREADVDRPQKQFKQNKSQKKALRFILGMALTMLVAMLICVLIWWFTSSHSYNALGQMIMIAGGILMVIGILSMGGHSHAILRKNLGTATEDTRQIVTRRQKLRDDSLTDMQVILYFLGSGLMCLFVGNLIVLGL